MRMSFTRVFLQTFDACSMILALVIIHDGPTKFCSVWQCLSCKPQEVAYCLGMLSGRSSSKWSEVAFLTA